MKTFFLLTFFLVTSSAVYPQTKTDELLVKKLSAMIFRWETENKIDSLATILDEKLVVINSAGNTQNKSQYISRLKGGDFVHQRIDVEESATVVSNSTAIVTGKGLFYVVVSGNKATLHLSYMEVFTRNNKKDSWRVLAIKANILEK